MSDRPTADEPPEEDPVAVDPQSYSGTSPFKPRRERPLIQRTFPVSEHLPHYPQHSLRRDLVAGITVAALALPSGMAYAQLAGLSPVAGLYALLLPAVAYVLLGSSRQLIVGPEGALAVLVGTAVAPLAGSDPDEYAALASLLAVLVAGIFLGARLLRLGWVADYFSRAVLVGYIHGIAVVLIIGQLAKLSGVSIGADDPLPQAVEFVQEIESAHGLTVLIGFVSLAGLLLLRWRFPKVPGSLVVVLAGIGVSIAFGLADEGVAVVGEIPAGLPTLELPDASAGDAVALLPAALGIFAVGYADGILTARSFAGRHRQHVDANQELLALGAANLASGLTQSFSVGASGSRTAVNDQMGGQTQVVGVIAAAVIAIVLLFLTAPVEELPSACLGAVIVAAAIGLIEPDAWRALGTAGRNQVMIAAVAAIGVIAFGVLQALIVAVGLSIVETVARSAKPHDAVLGWVPRLGRYADVAVHPSAQVTPGVVVYRLDDGLIFANARYFASRVGEAIAGAPTSTTWLVLDAEAITSIDASGVDALRELVRSLRSRDISTAVARLKSPMAARFETAGLVDVVGRANLHPTVRAAVEATVAPGDEHLG